MNRAERVLETLGTATFWLYKPCIIIWPFNLHSDLLDMELSLWFLLNMSPDFCWESCFILAEFLFFNFTPHLFRSSFFFALQSASFPYLNPPFFHLLEFIAVFLSSFWLSEGSTLSCLYVLEVQLFLSCV